MQHADHMESSFNIYFILLLLWMLIRANSGYCTPMLCMYVKRGWKKYKYQFLGERSVVMSIRLIKSIYP